LKNNIKKSDITQICDAIKSQALKLDEMEKLVFFEFMASVGLFTLQGDVDDDSIIDTSIKELLEIVEGIRKSKLADLSVHELANLMQIKGCLVSIKSYTGVLNELGGIDEEDSMKYKVVCPLDTNVN
jgi:hypothetical protein